MDEDIQDRLRGVAVGAAIGDVLGMPLEFGPAIPADRLVRTMHSGRLPAGAFTDDTEMALALADSLLERSPLDADSLARHFVAWYRTGPSDVGIQTSNVLGRIARGTPWQAAVDAVQRAKPESAGNGSVMRCWPVALAHWDDLDSLLADSRLQSQVTHPHPECVAGSAFVNATIYHLVHGAEAQAAVGQALDQVDVAARAAPGYRGGPVEAAWRAAQQRLGAPHGRKRDLGPADDQFLRGSRGAGGQPGQRRRHGGSRGRRVGRRSLWAGGDLGCLAGQPPRRVAAAQRHPLGRGAAGRARRSAGGTGGSIMAHWRMLAFMDKRLFTVSESLSRVLRDYPEAIGLSLDSQSWTGVEQLLAQARRHGLALTAEILQEVVEQDDQQRFAFSENKAHIHAAQDHSLPIDILAVRVSQPVSRCRRLNSDLLHATELFPFTLSLSPSALAYSERLRPASTERAA